MSKKVIFTDYKDDLLNSYLKDISKYKVLDTSEVAILISRAQQGDEAARNKVITSNLRFVVTIAKQYQNRKGDIIMDMIFALVLLLFVAVSVVWSVFVRKLAKTRIQSICAIASVLIALIGTIVLKSVVIASPSCFSQENNDIKREKHSRYFIKRFIIT